MGSRRAARRALIVQLRYLRKLPECSTLPPALFRAARRLTRHPLEQAAARRDLRRRLVRAFEGSTGRSLREAP